MRGDGGGAAQGAKERTKVTFVADYNPAWIAQVPWNVALEKGWYEEAGLDVEYRLPPSTPIRRAWWEPGTPTLP